MIYRKLGRSNINASAIGLGTWAIGGGDWWGDSDEDSSIKTIREAVDAGINLIDTAPCYGFGLSEEVVGKAIKGIRDKVVLSTKCGLWWADERGTDFFEMGGHKVKRCLEPDTIKMEVELSLKRLGTDYIDIYFTHWQSVPPHFTPIEKTMKCLMDLKRQGKIRAIGASNVTKANIDEYLAFGAFDVIQEKYSMLDRRIERELVPACLDNNLAIMAYSPIEQGLLTGKIGRDYTANPKEARAGIPWMNDKNRGRVIDMLESWQDLNDKYNCSTTQLVLAWTMQQSGISHVLCGARKPQHITETAASADIVLHSEDIKKIREDALRLGKPLE